MGSIVSVTETFAGEGILIDGSPLKIVLLSFLHYLCQFSLLTYIICTLLHIVVWDVIFADDVPNILENIVRLKSALTNIVEPDFGLLDELLRLEVLTRPELADVRSERTVYRRSASLLDLLISEEQCDKFLQALEQTGQQHIINFISQNGGRKTAILCKLCFIKEKLVDTIHITETHRKDGRRDKYKLEDIIPYCNSTVYRLAHIVCVCVRVCSINHNSYP